MMRLRRTFPSLPAIALAVLALAGCKDATQPQGPTPLAAELGPGIHPLLLVTRLEGDSALVELQLRRVGVEERVASFQGELDFDTVHITLAGAEFPKGVTGAWNEVAPGKVKFAGVAVEGLASDAAFLLHLSAAPRADQVHVEMKEVIAADDFANLGAKVVEAPHPVLLEVR